MTDDDARQVWLYDGGAWSLAPDPIDWQDGDDVRERYAEAGYTRKAAGLAPFLSLLAAEHVNPTGVVGLTLWYRPRRPPECLIDVQGTDDSTYALYVARFPDALDLMARWAPLVNTGTLLDVLGEIYERPIGSRAHKPGTGLVEHVARRASAAWER